MNIWKSFELFLALPLNIFRKGTVTAMHVETRGMPEKINGKSGGLFAKFQKKADKNENIFAGKASVEAKMSDNGFDFYVYNNRKVYSLLTSVFYKKGLTGANENKIGKIYNECTVNKGVSLLQSARIRADRTL